MKPSPNSFQARPLPKSFVIELTKRCNNHCVYCYLAEGPASQDCERDRSSEMSTQEVTDTIAKLCDEAPVQSLALSGGEPLLRDDIPEILSFMRNKGISPVVITNGTLLTRNGWHPRALTSLMRLRCSVIGVRYTTNWRGAGEPGMRQLTVWRMSGRRKAIS